MKILTLRNKNIISFFKKNKQLLIFVGVFLLFFCVGSLYVRAKSGNVSLLLGNVFNTFFEHRSSGSFLKVLFTSFFFKFILVFSVFALGLGAVGVFTSAISVAGFGIFYGMYVGYIYKSYSLSGIGFCALVLLPPLVVYVYSVIISSMSAMTFSLVLLKAIVSSQALPDIHSLFKVYIGRFIIAVVLALVSALFDAVMSNAFIGFFNF